MLQESIHHHDNPAVHVYQDYMMLCSLNQEKAALLTVLDYADGRWVDLLSATYFDSINLFCGTTVDDVAEALTDLIAQRYVEQQGGGIGARYRLNIPVVQESLNAFLHQMSLLVRPLKVQ